MTYRLSARSLDRLAGVHPDLRTVVELAITRSPVDFTVLEGLRTAARQQQLVASGASQTLNSRHLTGHAVDLGAFVDGEVRWDWTLYYRIAGAMADAARALSVPIRWGGCWDAALNNIADPQHASNDYVARRRAAGRRAFIDGPHFELPADVYPAAAVAA